MWLLWYTASASAGVTVSPTVQARIDTMLDAIGADGGQAIG